MTTNQKPNHPERVSRREALRRGAWGTAGLIAASGLSYRAFAAEPEKTPAQKLAEEKAGRDEAARAKAKAKTARIKSEIQVFLWGGMSHTDTWPRTRSHPRAGKAPDSSPLALYVERKTGIVRAVRGPSCESRKKGGFGSWPKASFASFL